MKIASQERRLVPKHIDGENTYQDEKTDTAP